MKKLFLTLGMLITTIALYGVMAQAETVAVTKVIEVPGATEKQVMDKVSAWTGSYGQAYDLMGYMAGSISQIRQF